jgi:hypothetical protein
VLALCARSGLVKVGVIAVDGTKLQANASRNENLDYEQLAREIVEEAKAVDAAEDELYGEARGDELPPEFETAQGRRGWLREAKQRRWCWVGTGRTSPSCRNGGSSASRCPCTSGGSGSGTPPSPPCGCWL